MIFDTTTFTRTSTFTSAPVKEVLHGKTDHAITAWASTRAPMGAEKTSATAPVTQKRNSGQ